MTKLLKARLPCPKCNSSDAYHEYEDGGYCFSCKHSTRGSKSLEIDEMNEDEGEFVYRHKPHRGLSVETLRHYGILTKYSAHTDEEICTYFPYAKGAGKTRTPDKKFYSVGDMKNVHLFGKNLFPAGSSTEITITEGEYDAASVYQIVGRPAVSVRSSSHARNDCREEWEYLNSFKKIVLAFDSDGPGQKAAQEVAALFDFNKVYQVEIDPKLKDANGYLQANMGEPFKRAWWNAKRYMPEGVLSTFKEFEECLDDSTYQDPIGEWPFPRLQDATYGLRPGEITLFTALEGIGKTEIIRAVEHHILKNTEHNVGIIHLEENKARTLKGLAGIELRIPVHLPDAQVDPREVKDVLKKLIKRDDRLHVYSHFGSDDPDVILDTIRFMAGACECRIIFLDHITMLATGLQEKDERQTLDYISTRLGSMVNELKFHLVLISHVNDVGQTRGSRNISKIANTRVDMFRDITSPDEGIRNTTQLSVSKNRFASITGPAGTLWFDRATFTLNEIEDAHDVIPT
jgi:twinkle protein